jgi:membrane peptidoglycan carboxypeptidase
MTDIQPTIRMRRRKRMQATHRSAKVGLGLSVMVSLITAITILSLTLGYAYLTRELPSPDILPALLDSPNGKFLEPTRIYDRSGTHLLRTLEHPDGTQKQYLSIDDDQGTSLPEWLINATIVASDQNFWSHPGYVITGLREGSHPTIAQRLVVDFMVTEEPADLRRGLRERLLAAQITQVFGQEKILEWFLNHADYGNQIYGVDAAAWVYFGKSAADLSLAESAVLATVAEAPGLNPHDTPEEALNRQQMILIRMVELGFVNVQNFRKALAEEVQFRRPVPNPRDPSAVFLNLVIEQLAHEISVQRLERGGLRVITTLDYDLQLQTDCAIQEQLSRIEDEATSFSSPDEACQAARLLPKFLPGEITTSNTARASAVALDPVTGQILTMVGELQPGLDPAHLPGHPPGSLVTPLIHLAAYTRGLSPASLAWDIPSNIPPNIDRDELSALQYHGPMRLRTALANDYLTPSLELLAQIGPDNVWRALPQLGLPSLELPTGDQAYLFPINTGEVTLLEITHAYSAFSSLGILAGKVSANSGLKNGERPLNPISYLRVEDYNGFALLETSTPQSRPVISAQLAYLITHILQDETARWASLGHPNPLEIGRPVGAKIGTTIDGRNLWTIGFTPQIVVGTWMGEAGENEADPISQTAVAGLWHAIIQYASRELPPVDWEPPLGISFIDVCDPSGMLPTVECPRIVNEVFLNGNEPTQLDTLYRKISINRETGRLATIFTPPELIDDQVFLTIPPEAEEWAAQAGLPTPPDNYDLVFLPTTISENVGITNPNMFAYVQGEITIMGSAGGEDFDFYRLQYGRGLNPQNWIVLREDSRKQVLNGELGNWDTTGLSGLYALQLLVVRNDQRVETATIQVTVDNQPPEVVILNPLDKLALSLSENRLVTLSADVRDDLALGQVDFYLNNQLQASLTHPPFATPWTLEPGAFILRVEAFDQAGNLTKSEVTFTVRE